MDKTATRNFAIWARSKLISDVAYRAGLMGITADGIADKLPQSTNSVQFYDIGTSEPYQITGKEISQRSSLAFLIKRKAKSSDYATAYTSIIEEVAYSWFNRLIAIRFMEVNDYLPSHIRVLSSESGKREPDIVTNPFDVDLGLNETDSSKILELKQNNDADELFKLLFIKQCNKLSDILPRLFEKTDDYTELLFNCSYVNQEGIVYRLTHDIPEEDFDITRGGQVEIIGWLYQYYNAELKDDTFALLKKNVKITKERIPSATQLFTPDWIVRYMVENSLGRLWTEGHTSASIQLRGKWKYYLEEIEQEPEVQVQLNDIRKEYAKLRPEDIKIIDPCMGSGHILVYAFDVLMQIYESEGYSQRDAAVQILENNIFGLDIDDRAAQLAYFAVMMKARQYNRRILDGTHDCHVLAIQESNGMSTLQTYMAPFGELSDAALRLINAYNNAKEYGSILSVSVTLDEIDSLESRLEEIRSNRSADVEELMVEARILTDFPSLLAQARIMVQKYDVAVTNPPYMGSNGMNKNLLNYVKENYKVAYSDMSTVFMDKAMKLCKDVGYISMINIPTWMFISSYEQFRNELFENVSVINMAHFARGVFGSDFGTTSFVFLNKRICNYKALYKKVFNTQGTIDSLEEKEKLFFDKDKQFVKSQEKYSQIPGKTLAYWISDNELDIYKTALLMETVSPPRTGMMTTDNNRFLRIWYEVDNTNVGYDINSIAESIESKKKWFPYNKGGDFRRWFGNNDYVVNWYNGGQDIKAAGMTSFRGKDYYFKEGITWSIFGFNNFAARFTESGYIFDIGGTSTFPDDKLLFYILALLNSKIAFEYISIVNPTVNIQNGDIKRVPIVLDQNRLKTIDKIARDCVFESKSDWDSVETSNGFKKHPLI